MLVACWARLWLSSLLGGLQKRHLTKQTLLFHQTQIHNLDMD